MDKVTSNSSLLAPDGRFRCTAEGENVGRLFGAIFGVAAGKSVPHFCFEDVVVLRQGVYDVLATLSPRQERVIKMRFGLSRSGQASTLAEIAQHFRMSKEAIRQTELKALKNLRHPTRVRHLKRTLQLIKKPEQVQELYLAGLSLTELPEFLSTFQNTRSLSLDNNQLKILPPFVRQWKSLEHISLRNNEYEFCPDLLFQFEHLKELDLGKNRLATVPEAILRLTQLEVLVLNDNLLSDLPESVCRLGKLRVLDLAHNCLAVLPSPIGNLFKLEHLDVTDNQLAFLPESMRALESLKRLYLGGNNLLGLPAGIARRSHESFDENNLVGPHEILEYYYRVSQSSRPLNEAKLILVGRGAVGKTSMVNRLVHNVFKDEKKTEGIKISSWKLTVKRSEDVQLNVWDFGGQEIMHATHQFFLTQRSLYLLLLSGREGTEEADAEYWLRLISSFGEDSPVIIVLNKIKVHGFDVNRRALQQKYPLIREFIETDCKDGTGIDQLREAIRRETDRLPHLRTPFPMSWFEIKDRLTRMRRNFLSFEEYRQECAKLGETDSSGQEVLAAYLHSLGIALNYKDDPRLQDTHILDPHWVTDGIYKILNSELLGRQKGEILLGDLSSILDGRRYPPRMHRFLLELMKRFELCFTFPDDDARYLIPELLDKQQPPEADQFNPEECLNFRYDYSVLPEGLLPRFIVRSHVLSENQPRWRTGVVTRFEACEGLVRADIQDKKIFISISGPVSNRRRLLSVIRSDFERIHRDIRNLRPQEMVPLRNHQSMAISYDKLVALERQEIWTFPEFVEDQVIQINVAELLNGVDSGRTQGLGKDIPSGRDAAKVFISYSHKDESLRNELDIHLKILQRNGWIDVWHDRKIEAGEDWRNRIDENLESADVILLLLSPDFIASDYCYEIEAKRALERHECKAARTIPIVGRPCNWQSLEFAKLQVLPKEGLPVSKWSDKDSAWLDIEEGLERVIKKMRKSLRRPWLTRTSSK